MLHVDSPRRLDYSLVKKKAGEAAQTRFIPISGAEGSIRKINKKEFRDVGTHVYALQFFIKQAALTDRLPRAGLPRLGLGGGGWDSIPPTWRLPGSREYQIRKNQELHVGRKMYRLAGRIRRKKDKRPLTTARPSWRTRNSWEYKRNLREKDGVLQFPSANEHMLRETGTLSGSSPCPSSLGEKGPGRTMSFRVAEPNDCRRVFDDRLVRGGGRPKGSSIVQKTGGRDPANKASPCRAGPVIKRKKGATLQMGGKGGVECGGQ